MTDLTGYYVVILGCLGGMGLVLALLGLIFIRASGAAARDQVKLDAQGISTDAEIVNLRSEKTSSRRMYHVSYYAAFKYSVTAPDGTKTDYTPGKEIYEADYRSLKTGDHIRIRYLPDQPQTTVIESGARAVITASSLKGSGWAMIALGGMLVLAGIFLSTSVTNHIRSENATATGYAMEKITAVNAITRGIAARLPDWKKASDQAMHQVLPPDTGMNLKEAEIDYGYCRGGHFYVYAWLTADKFSTSTDVEGFAYVEGSNPDQCHPEQLDLSAPWGLPVQGNWYEVSGEFGAGATAAAATASVTTAQ